MNELASKQRPDEGLRELALFAGAGGGILGGKLLGWRTVCAVEWDGYARDVLVARQNDGCLDPFPVWDDVQTFDGHPWRGRVDVISGGFPCQDISSAGKGAGIDGERSGMWSHMARIVSEVRPRFVFVENSPLLVGRGLARVLGDLAQMGYDAKWGVLGAHHVGAPHKRDRIWIVADADSGRCRKDGQRRGLEEISGGGANERVPVEESDLGDTDCLDGRTGEVLDDLADAISKRGRSGDARREDAMDADPGGKERMLDAEAIRTDSGWICQSCGIDVFGGCSHYFGEWQCADCKEWTYPFYYEFTDGCQCCGSKNVVYPDGRTGTGREDGEETCHAGWWATEPQLGRVAHGVAHRVDRLRCIGNGQVPAVAALAWNTLTDNRDHTADTNNEQINAK